MRPAPSLLLAVLASACATVGPHDVPPAVAAAYAVDVVERWPGAPGVLAGIELGGEATLREGDRVLYGLELERGGDVTRHLLRVEVARYGLNRAKVWFVVDDERRHDMPIRLSRLLELEFTLFDADGNELQRSRGQLIPDYFLESSFVDGVVAARGGDQRGELAAGGRLLEIVRMLQADPILKRLLAAVASVPWDLRLLFRRDLTLVPAFARGVAVAAPPADPFGAPLGDRYELPFDLLLNDDVFVRLCATVTTPRGPTGVAAGIVLLQAQQASDPERRIRMQLLACARGAQSEWARHGRLTTCGAVDEGFGLAFSPAGRWVVTPGRRGVAELRDLRAEDPTVPERLLGADAPIGDLAFLDESTVLVARGTAVEVFDLAAAWSARGAERTPVAILPARRTVRVLESAPGRTCFVGLPGGEVERWTFAGDPAAPAIETVRAPEVAAAHVGDAPPVPFVELPPRGFVVAGDDPDRVVVRWRDRDHVHTRAADGTWRAEPGPELPADASRAARWRGAAGGEQDTFAKHGGWLVAPAGGVRAFAGEAVQLVRTSGAHELGTGIDLLGVGHDDATEIVHGFDPSGRFYAFVGPGYRVLADVGRRRERDR